MNPTVVAMLTSLSDDTEKKQELATESGKLVIVPDEGGLRGGLACFACELTSASTLSVYVDPSATAPAMVRVVLLAVDGHVPVGLELLGRVSSWCGHYVIADPHMLYHKSFGERWVRKGERARALASLGRGQRLGHNYQTDRGDAAMILRVSQATSRFSVSACGEVCELRCTSALEEE